MANMCSIKMPAGWAGGPVKWESSNATYDQQAHGGVFNPITLFTRGKTSTTTAWTFNADEYGITCTSFPDASGSSDPLIAQAGAIQALQAATTGLQSQITAMAPWVGENAATAQAERLGDMSEVWGLFFAAAILILCLKGIQRLFNGSNND